MPTSAYGGIFWDKILELYLLFIVTRGYILHAFKVPLSVSDI